ncbi:MAG: hypothetical protein JXA37_13965 [Chloroflexia bacterium]|nr:hypothetical protein [Chloroflexia bacterium]
MKRRILSVLLATLIGGLMLGGIAWAMSSANFELDCFVPLSGSGGSASSTHYAGDLTVGQSAIGAYSGTSYDACLGYWCYGASGAGPGQPYKVYMPLTLKNYP